MNALITQVIIIGFFLALVMYFAFCEDSDDWWE